MHPSQYNASELLNWYADAGIDVALLDEPVNRFEEAASQLKAAAQSPSPAERKPKTTRPTTPPAPQKATIPDGNSIALAQETAKNAQSIEELHEALKAFQSCNLKFTARSTVFAVGNPNSKIMVVGGTPGREEDAEGVPSVGQSGQLLQRMLASIGLDRDQLYIAACAPWRPPGGRTMSPAEMEICRPFVERYVQLVDPDLLIFLGGVSANLLLKNKIDIMSLRGKWVEVSSSDRTIPGLPLLSPDYLLKNPGHKSLAWQDLLSIKSRINQTSD